MSLNAAAPLIIRYPQENTNTEALSKYSWRHGGQQLYQNSPPTPMSHTKHPKSKEQPLSRTTSNDHLILLPSLLASAAIINIATMIFTLLIIQRVTHH